MFTSYNLGALFNIYQSGFNMGIYNFPMIYKEIKSLAIIDYFYDYWKEWNINQYT